jgi:hypothetical protein
MEKVIRKFKSFEEANKAEIEYWRNAAYEEKIETFLSIQEAMLYFFYPDLKGIEKIVTKKKLSDKGES